MHRLRRAFVLAALLLALGVFNLSLGASLPRSAFHDGGTDQSSGSKSREVTKRGSTEGSVLLSRAWNGSDGIEPISKRAGDDDRGASAEHAAKWTGENASVSNEELRTVRDGDDGGRDAGSDGDSTGIETNQSSPDGRIAKRDFDDLDVDKHPASWPGGIDTGLHGQQVHGTRASFDPSHQPFERKRGSHAIEALPTVAPGHPQMGAEPASLLAKRSDDEEPSPSETRWPSTATADEQDSRRATSRRARARASGQERSRAVALRNPPVATPVRTASRRRAGHSNVGIADQVRGMSEGSRPITAAALGETAGYVRDLQGASYILNQHLEDLRAGGATAMSDQDAENLVNQLSGMEINPEVARNLVRNVRRLGKRSLDAEHAAPPGLDEAHVHSEKDASDRRQVQAVESGPPGRDEHPPPQLLRRGESSPHEALSETHAEERDETETGAALETASIHRLQKRMHRRMRANMPQNTRAAAKSLHDQSLGKLKIMIEQTQRGRIRRCFPAETLDNLDRIFFRLLQNHIKILAWIDDSSIEVTADPETERAARKAKDRLLRDGLSYIHHADDAQKQLFGSTIYELARKVDQFGGRLYEFGQAERDEVEATFASLYDLLPRYNEMGNINVYKGELLPGMEPVDAPVEAPLNPRQRDLLEWIEQLRLISVAFDGLLEQHLSLDFPKRVAALQEPLNRYYEIRNRLFAVGSSERSLGDNLAQRAQLLINHPMSTYKNVWAHWDHRIHQISDRVGQIKYLQGEPPTSDNTRRLAIQQRALEVEEAELRYLKRRLSYSPTIDLSRGEAALRMANDALRPLQQQIRRVFQKRDQTSSFPLPTDPSNRDPVSHHDATAVSQLSKRHLTSEEPEETELLTDFLGRQLVSIWRETLGEIQRTVRHLHEATVRRLSPAAWQNDKDTLEWLLSRAEQLNTRIPPGLRETRDDDWAAWLRVESAAVLRLDAYPDKERAEQLNRMRNELREYGEEAAEFGGTYRLDAQRRAQMREAQSRVRSLHGEDALMQSVRDVSDLPFRDQRPPPTFVPKELTIMQQQFIERTWILVDMGQKLQRLVDNDTETDASKKLDGRALRRLRNALIGLYDRYLQLEIEGARPDPEQRAREARLLTRVGHHLAKPSANANQLQEYIAELGRRVQEQPRDSITFDELWYELEYCTSRLEQLVQLPRSLAHPPPLKRSTSVTFNPTQERESSPIPVPVRGTTKPHLTKRHEDPSLPSSSRYSLSTPPAPSRRGRRNRPAPAPSHEEPDLIPNGGFTSLRTDLPSVSEGPTPHHDHSAQPRPGPLQNGDLPSVRTGLPSALRRQASNSRPRSTGRTVRFAAPAGVPSHPYPTSPRSPDSPLLPFSSMDWEVEEELGAGELSIEEAWRMAARRG